MSDIMEVVRLSLLSDSPRGVSYVWVEGTPERVKVYWHDGSWRLSTLFALQLVTGQSEATWAIQVVQCEGQIPSNQCLLLRQSQ